MSKIGIFGGTFDPIHYGHLIIAQSVLEKRNLDKIFFVPCYISPHKQTIKNSSSEHRINMLKLALEENERFEYSTFEIERGGISYSIDTIREFKNKYSEIDLIIGYDNLIVFDTWKEPDEILKLVNLVVLKRVILNETKINKYFEHAYFVDTPIIEISATEIRRRCNIDLSINYFLPEKVKVYILTNGLYK
jgi:nicotinate-nucleotide adenylyltransferase